MKLTEKDVELLNLIREQLAATLAFKFAMANSGEKNAFAKEDVYDFATEAWNNKTEFYKMVKSWTIEKLGRYGHSPEGRAKRIAIMCSSGVPALKRGFGEELVVAAMPDEAKNQYVINICKEAGPGANNLADLCQKAINLTP